MSTVPPVSRRIFFEVSGATLAAGALAASSPAAAATVADAWPERPVAKLAALRVNTPLAFHYPDAASPCVLLKLGRAVPGGVGPEGDVVAYSALCAHMGCPLAYDSEARTFKCNCHYSQFDPERGGQMVCGQATSALPQVRLVVAGDGAVHATGMHGLVYGRVDNLLGR
jgi:arsenite oxidase small subunit